MKMLSAKKLLSLIALLVFSLACNLSALMDTSTLINDDFSGDDSNWGVGSDTDYEIKYDGGRLNMKIFKENWYVWSTPSDEVYENIHMEVTAYSGNTDSTTAFGVICNLQSVTDMYYYFAMTPNAEYAIAKTNLASDDFFFTNDDQWAASDLIEINKDSYRIGADCNNGSLTFYVDGKTIAQVTDTTYTSGGVGLFTWSGEEVPSADVSFDDFLVTKIK